MEKLAKYVEMNLCKIPNAHAGFAFFSVGINENEEKVGFTP